MAEQKDETILLKVKIDIDELKQKLADAKGEIGKLKAENKTFTAEASAALKTGAIATYQELNEKIVNNDLRVKELNADTKNLTNVINLQTQANKAADGSYEQLLRNFQLASIELKNQQGLLEKDASGNAILTEAYKKSSIEVGKAKEAIIAFDQGIKDGRSNVGNYEAAFKKAFDQLPAVSQKLTSIQQNISQLNSDFKSGSVTTEAFTQQSAALTEQLTLTQEELNKISTEMGTLNTNAEVMANEFGGLRAEIAKAKIEAQQLSKEFGENSAQALDAQRKVASLTEELNDFNARVQALNPEQKFKAFAQAASAVAGGIAAAQGAMALFGDQSEATQQVLLKVQGALAFAQGINQLVELGDAFKNIKAVLGLTTVATQAQTVAQAEATAANVTGTVVTEGLAVAEGQAAVAATGLGTAIKGMLGPIGLVLIAAGALVAIFSSDAFGAASEDIDKISDSLENQVNISKRVIQTSEESIKKEKEFSDQQLALLKAQGAGDDALFIKKKENAKLTSDLNHELFESNLQQKKELEAELDRLSSKDLSDLDKDEKEKLQKSQEAAQKQIDLINKTNDKIVEDRIITDKEIELEELALIEKRNNIAQEASNIRASLIKNEATREIAIERESLNARLLQIKGSTIEENELRAALTEQSHQKITEINRKFAQQEIEDRSELEIQSTIEGTTKRIDAEIKAEERIRDFKLTAEGLTETQRQLIIVQSQNKIEKLEENRIDVINKLNAEELAIEKRKQDALFEIRKSRTSEDLDEQFQLRLTEINKNLTDENTVREAARIKELSDVEVFTNKELELLTSNADFVNKSIEEQAAERNRIHEEGRKKELAINEAYDAENLAAFYKASKAISDATRAANDKRIQDLIAFKQLEIEAGTDPEEAFKKQIEILNLQEEAEKNKLTSVLEAEELARQQKIENSNADVEAERERITSSLEFEVLSKEEQQQTLNSLNQQSLDAETLINEQSTIVKERTEKTKTLITEKYNKLRTTVTQTSELAQLQATSQILGQAASLFKKGSEDYKALASAQALIDTYASATAAYKAMAGIPVTGPTLGAIAAGLAVASGLANVAKINGIEFEEGGFIAEGPAHAEDGIKLFDPKKNAVVGEIEGEEAVISKKTTKEKREVVEDLIKTGGKNVAVVQPGSTDGKVGVNSPLARQIREQTNQILLNRIERLVLETNDQQKSVVALSSGGSTSSAPSLTLSNAVKEHAPVVNNTLLDQGGFVSTPTLTFRSILTGEGNKTEHISPHWMVQHPKLKPFYGLLETIRQSKTVAFAEGGFTAPVPIFPNSLGAAEVEQQNVFSELIEAIKNIPPGIITVEDIRAGIDSSVQVEEGGNL